MNKLKFVFPIAIVGALSSCSILFRSSSIVPSSSGQTTSSSGQTTSGTTISGESPTIKKTEMAYSVEDYVDNNYWTMSSCPTTGSPKILIIPIWFTDSGNVISSAYKENVKSDIEAAFLGSESETGWHSVSSYYYEESDGAFILDGVVSDWYECGYSISRVGADDSYTDTIVENATDWYFENNPSENRGDFDYDSDGYIDGVMAIYAAPDYYNRGYSSYNNLWAYTYWLDTYPSTSNPQPNVYFWSSYDFMYGSTNAYARTGKNYYGGDTSNCTIDAHTFIHEFGHVFGLDDYYDYAGNYIPAGGFSMQDLNIGAHDPYSALLLGWTDPYIPTETCTIQIGAFQTTKDLILLSPSWNSYDSPFDEYLLLELYTPTGLNEFDAVHPYSQGAYPQGASATGIRLWHVDARLLDCATANTLIVNPEGAPRAGVLKGMANTSYDPNYESYLSPLGSGYYEYNELQLIRNSRSMTYHPTSYFSNSDLFRDGSSFSMSTYSRQFVRGTRLNSNASLGWEFSVSISGSDSSATATITCTKI